MTTVSDMTTISVLIYQQDGLWHHDVQGTSPAPRSRWTGESTTRERACTDALGDVAHLLGLTCLPLPGHEGEGWLLGYADDGSEVRHQEPPSPSCRCTDAGGLVMVSGGRCVTCGGPYLGQGPS